VKPLIHVGGTFAFSALGYNIVSRTKQESSMSGILRQTQLTTQEILTAIGQLGPVELEKVARHVSRLRLRKATGQEAELLQTARRRRPRAFQRRYHELMQKRQEETLTEGEYQELLSLTDEAEAFDTRRMKALSALAEMRQTDLDTLIRDLGLARHG
jgi:hypothetical protein